ncbi:MAG: transcriptional repressor LexA [Streptosporangiaceae bacterium]|nr:transcriptional repressor LexA [Streptosporangiaceae bacterium]
MAKSGGTGTPGDFRRPLPSRLRETPTAEFRKVTSPSGGRPDPGHVLTWRQRKILRAIRDSVRRRGYPPSIREIAEEVGISLSSASYQLSALQRKGYLRRDGRRPRTMEVRLPGNEAARPEEGQGDDDDSPRGCLDIPSQEAAYVPLVGRIAPNWPVSADQPAEDVFPLPRRILGDGAFLALRAAGDSMIGAAIAEGDFVVVRRQHVADDGDIVVVMIDGEVAVRTFRRSGEHAWLAPHGPAHATVPAGGATLLGRVVAVMRDVRSHPQRMNS